MIEWWGMNEAAPKMPEAANENPEPGKENSAPAEGEDVLSPEEKTEKITLAQKVMAELEPYSKFDKKTGYPEVDAETNERLKKLELWMFNEIILDMRLGMKDLQEIGVWTPRVELLRMKKNVANQDRAPLQEVK